MAGVSFEWSAKIRKMSLIFGPKRRPSPAAQTLNALANVQEYNFKLKSNKIQNENFRRLCFVNASVNANLLHLLASSCLHPVLIIYSGDAHQSYTSRYHGATHLGGKIGVFTNLNSGGLIRHPARKDKSHYQLPDNKNDNPVFTSSHTIN